MPIVPVDPATIDSMFAPITGGSALATVAPVGGGLVNTLFRVTTNAGDAYALRVYATNDDRSSAVARMEREQAVLAQLADLIPVPRPVVADATGTVCEQPYMIYPWADGVTLNKCRLQHGADALMSLAHPLGRVLATIASVDVKCETGLAHLGIADALAKTEVRLTSSRARDRLGATISDALRSKLETQSASLAKLDERTGLVHGDVSGRNIIVRSGASGAWEVSSVLDWEMASTGSPMWDISSLFRYDGRYGPEFRTEFDHGYRSAGGALPDEWWVVARLVDVMRVVAILDVERDLPDVFEECRAIVGGLVVGFVRDPSGK